MRPFGRVTEFSCEKDAPRVSFPCEQASHGWRYWRDVQDVSTQTRDGRPSGQALVSRLAIALE
jgi:hypothetical protein